MSDGEVFGRYVLVERIAEGGMGEVWKARADAGLGLGRTVAVKRIAEKLGRDPEFAAMFVEEARITLALSHPNIVQLYEAGDADGRLFLAMELVEGRNLHEIIRRCLAETSAPLPLGHALTVAVEVARALDHAHRRRGPDGHRLGIVHRDVSPGNVLVSYEGSVKLTDFGLAKAQIRAYQSMFGTIKGKAGYMAPEQARGDEVDARADVFSLGATLYESLCGDSPYGTIAHEGDALDAARRGAVVPLRQRRPDLPEGLHAAVERALAARPEARPASADEFRQTLEAVARTAAHPLSVGELGAFVVGLFAAAPTTVPPSRFARALGAGLGVGGSSRATGERPATGPLSDTHRLPRAEADAAVAAALARERGAPGGEADAAAGASGGPAAAGHASGATVTSVPSGAGGDAGEVSTAVLRPAGSGRSWLLIAMAALIGSVAGMFLVCGRGGGPALPGADAGAPRAPGPSPAPSSPPAASPAPAGAAPAGAAPAGAAPAGAAPAGAASGRDAASPRRPRRETATPPGGRSAEPSGPPATGPPALTPPPVVPAAPPVSPVAPGAGDAVVSFGASPWADVSVDGHPLCRAPLGCADRHLPAGTHLVRFDNRTALRCRELTVHLVAGVNPTVAPALEPCP